MQKPVLNGFGMMLLGCVMQAGAAERSFDLDLGGVRFDPQVQEPADLLPPAWQRSAAGSAFRLVQFTGPIRASWLEDLRVSGLSPVQYIHPYTYVVWGGSAALASFGDHPHARWTGDFQPAFKVQEHQRSLDDAPRPTMVLRSRFTGRGALDTTLARIGAQLQLSAPLDDQLEVLQLLIPGSAYVELAAQADVYAVQEIQEGAGPRGESSNQSVVGNHGPAPSHTIVPGFADWLSATGYPGDGVTVAVVDGGIRTSHLDLVSRIVPCVSAGASLTSCSTSNDAHGTHVAGAIAGTASTGAMLGGFLRGQGVAPAAKLVQQRYDPFLDFSTSGMIANGMLMIYKESALSGAQLSNNSWGPTGTPQGYDIPTQQVDMISRDANPDLAGAQPVLAVWSIMNGRGDKNGACAPSSLGSPDEAKNLLAVGSTKLLSNSGVQQAAIFDVSDNSGHGNACDGRRVPHIVAPGCNTDSTSSSSNTSHATSGFCGTSMASPVVSGSVALFIEKYRAEHAGATPSPALIKAAFTAAAKNLQGFRDANNRVMGHRPDRFQGYGRLDLDAVMNPPQPVVYIEQDQLFTDSGQSVELSLGAADPQQPMRIMLAWTDAKGHGLGGSTPAWVNDLDLAVSAGSETYLGNVIGADGWSDSTGSADSRNNLEAVHLRPDQHDGAVTINVNATNIAADALNPFTPGAPAQDFALVCYNCVQQVLLGAADLALDLSAMPDPVSAGAELTLTADVLNLGPDTATAVVLDLNLPAELSFVSGAKLAGAGDWSCAASDTGVACVLTEGSLPVNALNPVASLSIVVQVDVQASVPTLEIGGTLSALQYSDQNPLDNTDQLQVGVTIETLLRDGFE